MAAPAPGGGGGGGGAVPATAQKLVRRGHQLELLQQAKDLCDSQEYVDLTIYCEDGVVRAHQMLLATASPFLKLLFQTSPLYGVDDIALILPEVKACLVQALVHFVYTGTVVSKEDHFYSLMKLVYALNMNASIEAESTNEKPTTFGAPLLAEKCGLPARLPHQLSQLQPQPQQQMMPAVVSAGAVSLPSQPVAMPQLPTQPLAPPSIALPTQPVPPAKMPKLATSAAGSLPPTVSLPSTPAKMSAAPAAAVQLPTQPVPLAGMVNGAVVKQEGVPQQQQQSYIAVDPTTGLSYKVEMANGSVAAAAAPAAAADASDPLAAIMNETIFTDTSGGNDRILKTTFLTAFSNDLTTNIFIFPPLPLSLLQLPALRTAVKVSRSRYRQLQAIPRYMLTLYVMLVAVLVLCLVVLLDMVKSAFCFRLVQFLSFF